MRLDVDEKDMAQGGRGPAAAFAMDILRRFGEAVGAPHLLAVRQAHVDGEAEGKLMFRQVPLSFWGGLDSKTGRAVDRSHPACGDTVTGRILAMPSGRGSSSASSVLAEAIRLGTAPAALILKAPDPIIAVGAIVARELYGRICPILICGPGDFARLIDGQAVRVVSHPAGSSIRVTSSDDRGP